MFSGFSKENMRCLRGRWEYFAYNGLKRWEHEVIFLKESMRAVLGDLTSKPLCLFPNLLL